MIIAIEGNIGCGKTTQLSILEKQGYSIYKEPIDKWPLDEFYQDPSRWGFLLQVVVLRTFIKGTEPISIHERSPMSSKYVFWNNLVESGIVTSLENSVFEDEYNEKAWEPDVLIYLNKNPELCHKHIQNRNQPGDSTMQLDYLETLNEKYNNMYRICKQDKYEIDGSQTVENVHKEIMTILNKYE
jgi:deoxyadenosine/deoxycytidine kinase